MIVDIFYLENSCDELFNYINVILYKLLNDHITSLNNFHLTNY